MEETANALPPTNTPTRTASRPASNGRFRFWLYFLLAIFAFATTSALGEYRMAQSTTLRQLGDDGWRPLTENEMLQYHLVRPFLGGLMGGILFLPVQCIPAIWFYKMTQQVNATRASLLAIPFGLVVGAGVSIVFWLCFGGWGPPFPIAACVSGAFITPMLVLTRRRQAPRSV